MNKFDLIGEITDENINAAIEFLKANAEEAEVTFYIDSPGGSVFSGLSLFRAMDSFKGKIIAEVGVMAASMAAFIALNCDEIHITKDTFMMIHQAWATASGNAEELRSTADLLEQASERLSEIVALRAKDEEAVAGYMNKDTWFGYQAILDAFTDVSLLEEDRYDAKIAASYSIIKETPAALTDLIAARAKEEDKPEETDSEEEDKEEKPEAEDKPEEEEKPAETDSDDDNPDDKEEETEEEKEDKEEAKAEVDNKYALSVIAKAKNYI